MTGGLIDDEQGGLRAWSGCVDQIFPLKQIGEKSREKKRSSMWENWRRRTIGLIGKLFGKC